MYSWFVSYTYFSFDLGMWLWGNKIFFSVPGDSLTVEIVYSMAAALCEAHKVTDDQMRIVSMNRLEKEEENAI